MATILQRKYSPILIMIVVGLLLGAGSIVCLLTDNEGVFCSLMICVPFYLFDLTGLIDGAWTYIIPIIYYLAIASLPVGLYKFFFSRHFKRENSLIIAIVITFSIQIGFSLLGARAIGEAVRGAGPAIADGMRNGAFDDIFGKRIQKGAEPH